MIKFLYVGDPHNQVRTPANRTDDFHDTFAKKVAEIKEIAKEEEVKAILQPGDFLNAPNYNNDFLMKVIDMWSFVPEKYTLLEQLRKGEGNIADISKRLQEDIPYVGAIGNHELVGESLKSYPRTSLSFLERLGFMTIASREEPVMFTDDDGTKVAITAAHYHHGMDNPEHIDDYIIDEKAGDVHIHLAHGYLAHKSLGDLIQHTLVDAIKETKADVTLAGHDHIGFSPVEIDGKLFANPGALTRTKADVKEISRDVKVIIVEVDKGVVTLRERKLKSAPAGKRVLDRTSITKKAAKAGKIESIKSIVKKAGVNKGQSVTDIIASVAKTEGIDKEVTADVVDRVTRKIDEMGQGETADVEKYRLSQLVLENFQSHKRSVFDVADGLNIFTGESSNGKSAVMRAMRWLMDNHGKSQRESFIRHGADKAKVTAIFDSGVMVSRVLERKGHGLNGWEIYDPSTGETETGNTQLAEQIKAMFGYTKVQYDTTDALDVNFMNQGDGWYFIGDHVKASERAKIIGAIFGTHYTDGVMKDLEKELRQNRAEVRVREKDIDTTNDKLKGFAYLSEVEASLEQASGLIDKLEESQKRLEKIEALKKQQGAIEKNQNTINTLLKACGTLDGAEDALEDLKVLAERHERIQGLLSKRSSIIRAGKTSRQVVAQLGDIEEAKKKLARLETLQTKQESLTQIEQNRQRLSTLIDKEKRLIKSSKNDVAKFQITYTELLDESGVCPTCGQDVDSHVLAGHLSH